MIQIHRNVSASLSDTPRGIDCRKLISGSECIFAVVVGGVWVVVAAFGERSVVSPD